jgi:type IV pilus assembly protein PilQ
VKKFSLLLFFVCCVNAVAALGKLPESISLDFVATPVQDVARSLSLAYDVPILVDASVQGSVTFHLEGVPFLEGLTALCDANGLELVKENNLFVMRPRKVRGESFIRAQDSLVSLQVKDKDVLEFMEEFSANTGLNVLWAPEIRGKVSGSLKDMTFEQAFRSLMETNGFKVEKKNSCLVVRGKTTGAASESKEASRIWKNGELFEVHLDGVSIGEALKELAELSQLNLAMYGSLDEKVQLDFAHVSLDAMLQAIFKGSRYTYLLDSNTLSVSQGGVKDPLSVTSLYPLKHLHSEKALQQLGKIHPGNGLVVSEVKEQNALLLAGSPKEIQSAVRLLEKIDVPLMQVTLSCIIVEFKKGKAFEIGLRGGTGRRTGEGNLGVKGFLDFLGKDATGKGAVGKIGILPDRFEMELASMEENNQAKVLARPKLTTLNGNKAELNVTNTVYYLVSQVSAEGYPITDYRSFNDGISLEITPSVTREGVITLDVAPEIKTAGRSSGDGPRDISTRNLKTVVLLKNGETLCLGGLVRKNETEVRSAVPFLGSLPLVGRLFSYTSSEEEESELAIFITPEVKF